MDSVSYTHLDVYKRQHLHYNELPKEKRGGPRLYIEDNVDPERMAALLDVIDLKTTCFNVITKSGGTAETCLLYTSIAAIKQALLDAGVEESEINTDSINIYANYDYSDNTEVIVGYTASNSLSVRHPDMDNVGSLIDAAFVAGANTLDNVQFTVQDDTQAREQALTMAVEDARRKADVLASAAGLQVASIERISEGGVSVYDSMRNYAADTVMACLLYTSRCV